MSHGEEKRTHVRALGSSTVVAIGNGANDVPMLDEAALAIAVLGREGLRCCSQSSGCGSHEPDGRS